MVKTPINIKFGLIVAERRNRLGISQEELAFRCGVHRTY
ncbi:MAG: helix-turn-helix transcriptional regulator, partial [Muribaculaceae bacterium]|nr:helix-turn-helix transcriptional regulator [Muribaculaceae bacterium]